MVTADGSHGVALVVLVVVGRAHGGALSIGMTCALSAESAVGWVAGVTRQVQNGAK